jgi:hypothetical protein
LGHGHSWVFNFILNGCILCGEDREFNLLQCNVGWCNGACIPIIKCYLFPMLISNRVKTHYWGAKIVVTLYFFWRSHVWTSSMSLLWRIFTMFLHIMVGQNPKKSHVKETPFKEFHMMWCESIFVPKNIFHSILKNVNILKKVLKWFLVFMKFVVSIKHCDSIWLE